MSNWSVLIAPRKGHGKVDKSLVELLCFLTLPPKLKSFVLYEKVNVFRAQDKSYKTLKEATVRETAMKAHSWMGTETHLRFQMCCQLENMN